MLSMILPFHFLRKSSFTTSANITILSSFDDEANHFERKNPERQIRYNDVVVFSHMSP